MTDSKVDSNNSTPFSLGSDNHSGVHPQIFQALVDANHGHDHSYGLDRITLAAQKRFKEIFGSSCEAHFVFNGTAANVLCLSALMKPYESVICASTSHLNLDECGAPERILGIKSVVIPSANGKISPEQIQPHLIRKGDQHYSQPRVISITQPTEYGTMYSYNELKELSKFAKDNELLFHIDGARFIYTPIILKKSFKELTEDLGVDAVSFGGTKNGLLFGEAVLLFNESAKKDFKFLRKQLMQLPSKQRFLSTQFLALLGPDELWKEIAFKTHEKALKLEKLFQDIPEIKVTQEVQANSVFAVFPKPWFKPLRKETFFYVWDELTWECRLMLPYDTTTSDLESFFNAIQKLRSPKGDIQ